MYPVPAGLIPGLTLLTECATRLPCNRLADRVCMCEQLIYSQNGVNITSTPVDHYQTKGPVALRLDWNGLSVTHSGTC
jgi:hypothetical protein